MLSFPVEITLGLIDRAATLRRARHPVGLGGGAVLRGARSWRSGRAPLLGVRRLSAWRRPACETKVDDPLPAPGRAPGTRLAAARVAVPPRLLPAVRHRPLLVGEHARTAAGCCSRSDPGWPGGPGPRRWSWWRFFLVLKGVLAGRDPAGRGAGGRARSATARSTSCCSSRPTRSSWSRPSRLDLARVADLAGVVLLIGYALWQRGEPVGAGGVALSLLLFLRAVAILYSLFVLVRQPGVLLRQDRQPLVPALLGVRRGALAVDGVPRRAGAASSPSSSRSR